MLQEKGLALKQMTDMQPCSKVLMQGRPFQPWGDITVLYFGTASFELQAETCILFNNYYTEAEHPTCDAI